MHVEKLGGGSGKSKRFHYDIISAYVPNNDTDSDTPTKRKIVGNGRPYVFKAEAFLTKEEYWALFPDERPPQAVQQRIDGM